MLGIDIGLEGIGLYLRRGPNEIFARSVVMELPQAEALADRRQKRGWRHCRKNRKRRLHRLKLLFAEHGLPWLDAERMSRALPFRERHRAINKGVASKEALSICIRHCVEHRGYDYGGTEEGAFPWGDSPLLSKATDWLSTAYVTQDLADKLQDLEPQLQAGGKEEEQRERFVCLLRGRLEPRLRTSSWCCKARFSSSKLRRDLKDAAARRRTRISQTIMRQRIQGTVSGTQHFRPGWSFCQRHQFFRLG